MTIVVLISMVFEDRLYSDTPNLDIDRVPIPGTDALVKLGPVSFQSILFTKLKGVSSYLMIVLILVMFLDVEILVVHIVRDKVDAELELKLLVASVDLGFH